MSTPGQGRVNPLFYYGAIEHAARQGASTADIWSQLRGMADNAGLPRVGLSASQVSTLRGQAGRRIAAERSFAGLADDFGIGPRDVVVPPWARPLAERNATPDYAAQFLHTFTDNGVQRSEWRTVRFSDGFPATAGDIRRAIELDAQAMADKYGVQHLGVSNIALLAV